MNLSMKWLSEFVSLNVTPKEFSDRMTMTGSKVECFETFSDSVENVVVGKVLSLEKHPDADKLTICQIDIGKEEPVQIVTGPTNLKVGDLVPAALNNSLLPNGTKIKKGKLRGVISNGMLCSLGELCLTLADFPYAIEDGIFVIEEDCVPGQDICSAIGLDDTSVEFEITSNRPDCLSVIGLAREAAVSFDKPLSLHTPSVKGGFGDIKDELKSVTIENGELCPKYSARVVKNVKVEPSPRWMRERLRASGVRPINNIVDITNYVMLEYGQPMHAFDIRFIDERTIKVRNAVDGEKITTLDGIERTLGSEMLVIADANKPVAVAGVMGGEYSGIMDDTTTIVFESACFNGPSVRRTAKALGMRTDASARYEKDLDPEACLPALDRACELVEMLGAGEVMNGIMMDDKSDKTPRTVGFEPDWINKFLDINLPAEKMIEILEKLDCKVENNVITVPSFRHDLEHKADIAEEIARIYGYNEIPSTGVKGSSQGKYSPEQKFEFLTNSIMIAQGISEIMTYSFVSPKYYDKVCMPADSPLRKSVVISNPLGEDTSIMRTVALPSMLEILAKNYNNRNLSAYLYEIGKEYIPDEDEKLLPEENKKLVIGMYGEKAQYYYIKGVVEELFEKLGVEGVEFEASAEEYAYHPGRCAVLTIDGKRIGVMGEIHPTVADNYGIGARTYAAEPDFDALFASAAAEKQYAPLPKFPAVTRDLAIICNSETPVAQLEKAIRKGAGKLLENVKLFDVYQGKQIEAGKKSVAYNITLRSKDTSLTNDEAGKIVDKIIDNLAKLGAALRS